MSLLNALERHRLTQNKLYLIGNIRSICDKSAIENNLERKKYYLTKTEKGKNKMSTINSIRNKMDSRGFVVVIRKTPDVDFMKYAV